MAVPRRPHHALPGSRPHPGTWVKTPVPDRSLSPVPTAASTSGQRTCHWIGQRSAKDGLEVQIRALPWYEISYEMDRNFYFDQH